MKTKAYVVKHDPNIKDEDNQNYIVDDGGSLLVVDIKEALDLREKYRKQAEHTRRIYKSRDPIPEDRDILIARKSDSPHYAFKSSEAAKKARGHDETFSHEASVLALSRQKNMTIKADGKRYEFEFTKVYREFDLRLPNGKSYRIDVFGLFDKDKHPEEYKNWGGKVAIEVTNTHACEGEKLHELELCNIPVFEYDINNDNDSRRYRPEKKGSKVDDTYAERCRYEEKLAIWFAGDICMNLKIDPVSKESHEKEIATYQANYHSLESKHASLESDFTTLVDTYKTVDEIHRKQAVSIKKSRVQNEQYLRELKQKESDLAGLNAELSKYKSKVANLNSKQKILAKENKKLSIKNDIYFGFAILFCLLTFIAIYSEEVASFVYWVKMFLR